MKSSCSSPPRSSPPIEECLPELCECPETLGRLRSFAARRLRTASRLPNAARLLDLLEPDDLIGIALEKVLSRRRCLPEAHQLGRLHSSRLDCFTNALRSVINSEISNLTTRAEARTQHLRIDVPGGLSTLMPNHPTDLYAELNLRDLHRLLFPRLRSWAARKPDLLLVIQAWEEVFLDADRIPDPLRNRKRVLLVRQRARQILVQLVAETRGFQ